MEETKKTYTAVEAADFLGTSYKKICYFIASGELPTEKNGGTYRITEEALEELKKSEADEIGFWRFLQFKFMDHWAKLRAYANSRNIRIIGDIPIYAAFDSSDSWADPELFRLDEDHMPVCVAGCPPDAFAAEGQLWGNPIYRWDVHEATGFALWIRRMEVSSVPMNRI